MTNLSHTQEAAINRFVVREKVAGNWGEYDKLICPSLGEVNGLIDWLRSAPLMKHYLSEKAALEILKVVDTFEEIEQYLSYHQNKN